MKLGFMQVYNEMNWVKFAIEQAMCLCDKLLIVEGSQFVAFPHIPERSNDGTLDIINDKAKEHQGRILLTNTSRRYKNYRQNQCANFNHGLEYCDRGDYFIQLDADEFFLDEWIAEANELMREGKADLIKAVNYEFAISFKWRVERERQRVKPIIIKKTEKLYFFPTHKPINPGENVIIIPGIGCHHYDWVKPSERMLIRMRTSGMYSGMVEWFKKVWQKIEPEDGKKYSSYAGHFTLRQYEGHHPAMLDNHPWRHVKDVRRLN